MHPNPVRDNQGCPSPISSAERAARVERAQMLMRQQDLSAMLMESGATMFYFTGVEIRRSERPTCAVIPAEGDIGFVTPAFEEPSVREMLAVRAEVRCWQEHEDALAVVAGWLRDRDLGSQSVSWSLGIEDTTRHFVIEGLKANLNEVTLHHATSIVRGCRSVKSAAEIAQLQHAADITIEAYRQTIPQITPGMRPADMTLMMREAHARLGGVPVFESALIGEAAAYPHGTKMPQIVRAGDIVLMDCGCSIEGYHSDISRTFVVGTPSIEQRKVWRQVQTGQRIAFETAQLGESAGAIDSAVRTYYESQGYGPAYSLPGLPHRIGHGIGLDIHEPLYLVRDERSTLEPGMCFSNEPGIYIPGAFGIRLEDCFYMTERGPEWFSQPSVSIEQPV